MANGQRPRRDQFDRKASGFGRFARTFWPVRVKRVWIGRMVMVVIMMMMIMIMVVMVVIIVVMMVVVVVILRG